MPYFMSRPWVQQAATPAHLWPSLHAGQQEIIAGAAIALRIASPPATAVLAPHILAAAERVPRARQRLALLTDVFFFLLVRPARGGRALSSSVGDGGDDSESGRHSGRRRRGEGSEVSRGVPEGAQLFVSVLETGWFSSLVSSELAVRTSRVLFREETVAALATACAQVGTYLIHRNK